MEEVQQIVVPHLFIALRPPRRIRKQQQSLPSLYGCQGVETRQSFHSLTEAEHRTLVAVVVPEPFQLRLGREVGNIHLPAKGGIAQAHDALRRHTLFEQNRQAVLQEVGADEPLLLANPEEHVVRNRVLKEPVVGIVFSRALSFDIALDKLLEPFARIVSNGVVPYFAVGVERKIELESVFL